MSKEKLSIFWFRRDLRLEDNYGLFEALKGESPVLPIFIFDDEITSDLDADDSRITFIYDQLNSLNNNLKINNSSLYCLKGNTINVWQSLVNQFDIDTVYTNEDYEPYAILRDKKVEDLLAQNNIGLKLFKDQVIFAKNDVLKADKTPYTVFTPYKNKWLDVFKTEGLHHYSPINKVNFHKTDLAFPTISDLGFKRSEIEVKNFNLMELENYEEERNFPALSKTSYLSPHLRFGTISVRQVIRETEKNHAFLIEIIWREFFMQIIYHFPKVVDGNFKKKYDHIAWRNDENEFEKWKEGKTGYPIVDAGMRELNSTGYMHNRVRMVVGSFLCKHLLIDWRWGEAYFAEKLLDFDLSANNGNWQWVAGTGCDSAPYFRVFNPTEQIKKFDSKLEYIKKWVPELQTFDYPEPMVEHKFARLRALDTYKKGLQQT